MELSTYRNTVGFYAGSYKNATYGKHTWSFVKALNIAVKVRIAPLVAGKP